MERPCFFPLPIVHWPFTIFNYSFFIGIPSKSLCMQRRSLGHNRHICTISMSDTIEFIGSELILGSFPILSRSKVLDRWLKSKISKLFYKNNSKTWITYHKINALPFCQDDASFACLKRSSKRFLVQQRITSGIAHVVAKLFGISMKPGGD